MIYIAFTIFTLLILLFVFYQWQYFMIFSPLYYREEVLCQECTLLSMKTDEGIELEGALYEPKEPKSTLLVFVGRSHDAVGLMNRFVKLYPHTRIISFNYRSYGKSQGIASEKNLFADGLKIAKLVKKNYGDFYLLGFSIGSSVAAYVASNVQPKALFLLGAFSSITSLVKIKYKLNFSSLLRYRFNTKDFVQNIDAPTYLFVSKVDEIVSIESARELKESVKNLQYYQESDILSHKELLWDSSSVCIIKKIINST